MNEKDYGMELVLDLVDCNENISNYESIANYAKALCVFINMKPYGDPIISHFGHNSEKTSGYSLVQLIETSSITAHFSEKYKSAHINVFSCMEFNPFKAAEFSKQWFGGKILNLKVIARKACAS